jgi:hypothetical protein
MIALQSFVDNLVCSAVRFVPRDKAAPKQVPKEKLNANAMGSGAT